MQNQEKWTEGLLNINGLTMFANGTDYQYKLPFVMTEKGCCTKISPWLYVCDKWLKCCCCCFSCCCKEGKPNFMDFVDQDTGEQVRYDVKKPCCNLPCFYGLFDCCSPPKVNVFHDGQYKGHAAVGRCCNSCRTCMEDVRSNPVPGVMLYDEKGNRYASTYRNGRGCCCTCQPKCPMMCIPISCCGIPSSAFTCLACTCECWPGPWGCCRSPFNCICDPVCGQCCVRGNTPCMKYTNVPLLACCIPCTCCAIFCCCPSCETKPLPIRSTFKYERINIYDDKDTVGEMQFQYRGNAPSSYTHHPETPFQVFMRMSKEGLSGLVASSIMIARAYTMGLPAPLLSETPLNGKSPGYDGMVYTENTDHIKVLEKLLDDDNLVTGRCVVGSHDVTGYTLIAVGYKETTDKCCYCSTGGGTTRAPVPVTSKEKSREIFQNGYDLTPGDLNKVTWTLRFYLKEPEKDVLTAKTANVDSKFEDYFHSEQLEEVALACTCVRYCTCQKNGCNKVENVCCRCPCYARPLHNSANKVAPQEVTPAQVDKPAQQYIMTVYKKN